MIVLLACNKQDSKTVDNRLFIGEYRYFADAAQFKECRTNKIYPVLFDGDHIKMERRYLKMNPKQLEWIAADIKGYLKLVPNEDTMKPQESLYITEFIRFDRTVSCKK